MKMKKIKNLNKQKNLEKNELQRTIISMLRNKKVFKKEIFYQKYFKIDKINYCQLTFRSRAIYKKYLLSRIKIKEFCFEGIINGLKKVSW